ncbi:hypothetical protein MLD38_039460 [Melastoma candidum]|uniref:Uncharacterized protein n=1 Tax=Melastoma candidum TaxID=119954 RepID=A0ACB9L261_9MYRT|nr:hypothetical protein MLD38_039460 [Melastoma candidum]
MAALVLLLSSSLLLLIPYPAASLPLCTDSRSPLPQPTPLTFCPYNGTSCCNSTQDLRIQKQFEAMNVSDPSCRSVMKWILCARCDPFSGELFTIGTGPRTVPLLCNSTVSANSSQSSGAARDYCSGVWDTCLNASMLNSPFAPSLQGQAGLPMNSSYTKLTELWQSKNDFCNAFGGAALDESVCFDGEPVKLNATAAPAPPSGLCIERLGNGSYLDMVAHPDGSNHAFFSDQKGYIWLGTIPAQGSGGTLEIDESNPFLDLTDEVHFDTEFGMMGIAFHPNFAQNGRFFASFNCDKSKWPGCTGRCSCNSDVNCDPSQLPSDNGAQPCQYQSVIAEYSANGTSSGPSAATTASPAEVRRIFTMGLPFTAHHGGQILFGPGDGYLYFMMGDGGGTSGDPYNFSQNKKSMLGKIMRLDVDNIPSAAEVSKLGLWGNYSIPKDNPYTEDSELQPEIWTYGMRNPWRCSFDAARPDYFMCGDVGQDEYEEVDVITKGGNYGWRVYEGPLLYNPPESPGGNTSAKSINTIFPVVGYTHSEVNKNLGSASITGGYFYRGTADPCMYGSYLYGDLYAENIWAAIENPGNSGKFNSSRISFSCAKDSPIPCETVQGSQLPSLLYIFSFGQDNQKDIYLLTYKGVYRVVRPSRCGYTCAKENVTAVSTPSPASAPSNASSLVYGKGSLVLAVASWLLLASLVALL